MHSKGVLDLDQGHSIAVSTSKYDTSVVVDEIMYPTIRRFRMVIHLGWMYDSNWCLLLLLHVILYDFLCVACC